MAWDGPTAPLAAPAPRSRGGEGGRRTRRGQARRVAKRRSVKPPTIMAPRTAAIIMASWAGSPAAGEPLTAARVGVGAGRGVAVCAWAAVAGSTRAPASAIATPTLRQLLVRVRIVCSPEAVWGGPVAPMATLLLGSVARGDRAATGSARLSALWDESRVRLHWSRAEGRGLGRRRAERWRGRGAGW